MKAFLRDESGATAVEYGILAALVSVVVIAAVTALGPVLTGMFEDIAVDLDAAKAKVGAGAGGS